MWEDLQAKIIFPPTFKVLLLTENANEMLYAITKIKEVDSSFLKARVDEYFSKACQFETLKSLFSYRMTLRAQSIELENLNA